MRLALLVAALSAPRTVPACELTQAESLLNSRRTNEARRVLAECVETEPPDARVASAFARTYLLEGDPDRAVPWLERAAGLDPRNSDHQLWLGRAYGAQAIRASVLRQAPLARKVRRAFERAITLDPENLAARLSLVEYYLRAPGFLGGSLEKARREAEEIRRRDGFRGHRAFGLIAEHEKRFDLAAQEYERAAEGSPQSADPLYWRAELAVAQKDWEKAFDLYEALWRDRSEAQALYEIGQLAATSGQRLDRGEECLKLYLEHEPNKDGPSRASAHDRLGALYERRGQRELARLEYTAAIVSEPTLTRARRALERLNESSRERRRGVGDRFD